MGIVTVNNLTKVYELNGRLLKALDGINLEIDEGSFVTIVGKSGSGKTTFLRILCGLEEKTGGDIIMPAEKIITGMVFQEPRLMPWLTVKQNIAFSIQNKYETVISEEKVSKCLDMLGLKAFKDAYPAQISAGMAQRVSLGRTLCYEPQIILMDEPLSALDAFNRRRLQEELLEIYLYNNITIVFVTHDVDEAVYLGKKVVVMDGGRIIREAGINLPYPRDARAEGFFKLREDILSSITEN